MSRLELGTDVFHKCVSVGENFWTSNLTHVQIAFDFFRYMTENFSALEYKTQEEVLLVIRHLTEVLSVTGTQVVEGFIRKRAGNTCFQQPTNPVSSGFRTMFSLLINVG